MEMPQKKDNIWEFLDELRKKIYSGEIEDSKTVAALLAYADKYGK